MKSFIENFLIIVVVTAIALEILPYFAAPYMLDASFSRSQFSTELFHASVDSVAIINDTIDTNEDKYISDHILHPYLGFVGTPRKSYNKFGFPGPDPITKVSEHTFNICITGGSVAKGVFEHSKDHFIEILQTQDFFKDKKINIVLLALDGFKQPQQLLALNYFLSLGAQYDLVINIDGFSDIVFPYSDNLPDNVYPNYPRHWNMYSRKKMNTKVQGLLIKKEIIESKQDLWQGIFTNSILQYSNFGLLVWKSMNDKSRIEKEENKKDLRDALKNSEFGYQSAGPKYTFSDTATFFTDQADMWMNSSIQMGKLAQSMNFEYFHFIQPNQYYFNSKEFTEEELLTAYTKGTSRVKSAVALGFPFLIGKGFELKRNDVNFYDLTMIFKDEKRTVYLDQCCLLNKIGYDIITDEVCGRIFERQAEFE